MSYADKTLACRDCGQGFTFTTGELRHRIPTGAGPHGLTFFPQPGRFSIGHNGVYR